MENKTKIGNGFYQSGYGRGFLKASIYLIDGFAYARSAYAWKTDYNQLDGDLKYYVRVNAMKSGNNIIFAHTLGHGQPHHAYQFSQENMKGIQNKQFKTPLYMERAKTKTFEIGNLVTSKSFEGIAEIQGCYAGVFECVNESGLSFACVASELTLYSDYQKDEYFDRNVKVDASRIIVI